jgi:hypothetical protein
MRHRLPAARLIFGMGALACALGLGAPRRPPRRVRSQARLEHGRLHRKLSRNRALAPKVALLEMIADQPEAQRFSL